MSQTPHTNPGTLSKSPYVIMLVPACNEERHIHATLASLNTQTRRPDETIVIINNSTDRTEEIVRDTIPSFPGLKVLRMEKNEAKKSGALNFALRTIELRDNVIVGEMDADTQVAPDIIEEGLKEFAANPQLGGVCSRCGVKPFHECGDRVTGSGPSRWEYIVWLMQAFEYGLTDRRRADISGNVKVMAGAFTLYTADALRRVCAIRHQEDTVKVYDETSRVEDYVLTLDVRSSGLVALAGQTMRSWTDVPVRLFGPQSLLAQRTRWYGGSVDELRRRRLRPETRHEVLMQALSLFLSLAGFLAIFLVAFIAISPAYDLTFSPFVVLLMVSTFVLNWLIYIPAMKYIEHVPVPARLLLLLIFPMQLYMMWDYFVIYYSYFDSFFGKRQAW